MSVLDRKELEESPLADLHTIASELGIESYRRLPRAKLIGAILGEQPSDDAAEDTDGDTASGEDEKSADEGRGRRTRGGRRRRGRSKDSAADSGNGSDDAEIESEVDDAVADSATADVPDHDDEEEEGEPRTGVLDILPNGSGFMRPDPFAHSREDVYVSPAQIRRCELRAGDEIAGPVRPPRRSERYPSLVRVDSVNGQPPEPPQERARFEELTAVFAGERLPSPDGFDSVPFGKGSRVAVGGPPGAGATSLLRAIAGGLGDEIEVVVVLAGVRPEEVTEWRRDAKGPVAGGSFDRSIDEQAQVAEIAVERAKRAAESGRDAVIVIDSLDALPSGAGRRVFGAARNTEEAGSVTVIAATGMAAEYQRVATTRIVLEPSEGGKLSLAQGSGTSRAEQLS